MNRNTIILRLAVLAGALIVGFVLITGLLATLPGGEEEAPQALLLSDEELHARLAESGRTAEGLERQGALVRVRLQGGGEIWLDAASGREIAMPERRGEALQTVQLRRMLRQEGYEEIGSITWRRGAFETEATDGEGQRWSLRLDTYDGSLLERRPL